MQHIPLTLKTAGKFHTEDQLTLVQYIIVWDFKKCTFLTTKNSSPVIRQGSAQENFGQCANELCIIHINAILI